jgi:hypothetical protein
MKLIRVVRIPLLLFSLIVATTTVFGFWSRLDAVPVEIGHVGMLEECVRPICDIFNEICCVIAIE